MASSENLATMESLAVMRPYFNDLWLPDFFSRETETLTRALQMSFDPVQSSPEPVQTPTPTASGLSGSDPDSSAAAALTPKRPRAAAALGASGKVSKRKSRATKRSQTTFITADAANFRQMVQQVTGVKLGSGAGGGLGAAAAQFVAPIIKPEPQRGFGPAAARFPGCGGGGACPPTLDTSAALLLDQSQAAPAVAMTCPPPAMMSPFVADGSSGLDFDAFQSFPTLESWKVM